MKQPSKIDLVGNEFLGLDHEQVLEHFLGKSQEEAREYFPGRCHYLTEDFMWMTHKGLLYYLPPFFEYLKSDAGKYDWDAAHGILCSISAQIELSNSISDDLLQLMKQICNYVKQNCKRYNISPHEELYQSYLNVIEGAEQS